MLFLTGNKTAFASGLHFNKFMPSDKSKYYRYHGSMTHPPCKEVVVWSVFRHTLSISSEQVRILLFHGTMSSMVPHFPSYVYHVFHGTAFSILRVPCLLWYRIFNLTCTMSSMVPHFPSYVYHVFYGTAFSILRVPCLLWYRIFHLTCTMSSMVPHFPSYVYHVFHGTAFSI